jgi:hypothetical protein
MENNNYDFESANEFPPTVDGFIEAMEWAKTIPHPENENQTLFDKLYDPSLDGYHNIFRINQAKKSYNK